MKREISSPHDKLFKQLLGEPENAASFLANNLPGEITSQLDFSTLQVVQVSFIDAQFVQSEADLLFSITIANRPGYVYFLFEHQSSPFEQRDVGNFVNLFFNCPFDRVQAVNTFDLHGLR